VTSATCRQPEIRRCRLRWGPAEGFTGIVYALMGPGVPGELEAMAELLELVRPHA
jgi:hypothetical protein